MSKSAPQRLEPLSDRHILHFTVNLLQTHFPLDVHGYDCTMADLWRVLVASAARRSTVEATCQDLEDVPASNTIRHHLQEQLATLEIPQLQACCNAALQSQVPAWLWQTARYKPLAVALDLHAMPYYGKADLHDPDHWICRGEAEAGTTRFYRCATAYVIRRDVRVTLAVAFVAPTDRLVEVVQSLVGQVQGLGFRVARLYCDKAFCTVPVLRYLHEETAFSAIVAASLRGKVGGRGLRALCRGRGSYRTDHTFRSAEYGSLSVPVGVVRTIARRRDGSTRPQWLVYVLLRVFDPLPAVRESYRRRFGIESSYRLLEAVRLRTTSNQAARRFLSAGLALLLNNIRIALQWLHLQQPGSGPPRVAAKQLTLDRLARFLVRAVEALYGVISQIPPPSEQSVIY
jgi:hypothetical protein